MPRSENTHIVTIGPMPESVANSVASLLIRPEFASRLHEQHVAIVSGLDESAGHPRQAFTGPELDLLVEIAAACWAAQRNGAPGRPRLAARMSRLTLRAYHEFNGLGPPTSEQLSHARSSDYY
jgi:hypothetical protein